jgi:hypothetical protein
LRIPGFKLEFGNNTEATGFVGSAVVADRVKAERPALGLARLDGARSGNHHRRRRV